MHSVQPRRQPEQLELAGKSMQPQVVSAQLRQGCVAGVYTERPCTAPAAHQREQLPAPHRVPALTQCLTTGTPVLRVLTGRVAAAGAARCHGALHQRAVPGIANDALPKCAGKARPSTAQPWSSNAADTARTRCARFSSAATRRPTLTVLCVCNSDTSTSSVSPQRAASARAPRPHTAAAGAASQSETPTGRSDGHVAARFHRAPLVKELQDVGMHAARSGARPRAANTAAGSQSVTAAALVSSHSARRSLVLLAHSTDLAHAFRITSAAGPGKRNTRMQAGKTRWSLLPSDGQDRCDSMYRFWKGWHRLDPQL